jgi:DNA-binding NtrC family response regulator
MHATRTRDWLASCSDSGSVEQMAGDHNNLVNARRVGRENLSVNAKNPTPHVLVVDDERLIRWSVAETLSGRGMNVIQAWDGATTLKVLKNEPVFDVIVLDLRLPDVDDLSLLQRIRELSPSTAVVLMSAFGSPEVKERAMQMGARHLFNKPFEMGDMAAAVEGAMSHAP